MSKLGSDAALDYLPDVIFALDIDVNSEFVDDVCDLIKCLEVGLNNLGRMDMLNEWFRGHKTLSGEDND